VRSEDFEQVYMIAADVHGAGLEGDDDIGVWSKSGPPRVGGGLIYAVDLVAQEFSDWSDADKTDATVTESNHGVEEARACAGGYGRFARAAAAAGPWPRRTNGRERGLGVRVDRGEMR
jgi:hypothetical protein